MNDNRFKKKQWNTPILLMLSIDKTKSGPVYNKNEHKWGAHGPTTS